MDDVELLRVCHRVVDAIEESLSGVEDWNAPGERPGQYGIDLVADHAALKVLSEAGLGVLSEESGLHRPESRLMAVLDPVDGSTNASRRIRYYAASICIVEDLVARVALVANLASRERYVAIRDKGAWKGQERLLSSRCTEMRSALVALSGFPRRHLGWAQYRSFGAAALELCAVADGSLDAFTVGGLAHLAPWDYLGGVLMCREAGAVVCDLDDRELVAMDPTARRAVAAAATPELLTQLRGAVRGISGPGESGVSARGG